MQFRIPMVLETRLNICSPVLLGVFVEDSLIRIQID